MNNLARVKEVVSILNKNGLAALLVKNGFAWYLPFFSRFATTVPSDVPQRLRKSMEELGGAYVKLGQMLSLRPDLIPQEYCDEFAKLLDDVAPEPLEIVTAEVEKELKKPFTALFSHIDHAPLGSASIAQVHKARLKDGSAVAIKVQRPHIKEQMDADIGILRIIATKIQKRAPHLQPLRILSEFERYTAQELNFVAEGHNLEAIAKATKSRKIEIPRIHWAQTTPRVLTMDFLEGKKLSALSDKKPAVDLLMDALLEQIFVSGIFHADLHPGNVLVMHGGKLGLLDFGITGRVNEKTRELGIKLYSGILAHDHHAITETLLRYGQVSADTNVDAFKNAVERELDHWWQTPSGKVTHLMHQLFILAARHRILLPQDTVLLGKALMTAENTIRRVNPNYDFLTHATPKITALLEKQKTPRTIISKLVRDAQNTASALRDLPEKTLDAVDAIRSGRFSVQLKDNQFRHLGQDINLSSNRVSFALVSAALILAGATMVNVGPKIGTYGLLSVACLTAASFFVFLLFVSITREHSPIHDPH